MKVLDKIQDFINSSNELPSLPDVVIELNMMIAKNDVNIDKLSKLIETDVALTTSILAMVNSPLYRGFKEITSIKDGIMKIGIRETQNIVYSSSIFPLFNDVRSIDSNSFWKYSKFAAYTAEILGEMIHYPGDLSDLYTSGLLHIMGVLVLGQYFPDELIKVLSNTLSDQGVINTGIFEVFNTIHSEIGGLLLKRWQLPDKIVQTALYHHYPEQADDEYKKEAKIIRMANEVTILEGYYYFSKLDYNSYPFKIKYDSQKIINIRETIKEKLTKIDAVSGFINS